ncbi:DUF192 domain-containing protein [Methylococcaceae bacterium WWC4]|nr:DUF192 domain-containing protein [Methylococcaceae bacterium WWC4]
MTLSETRILLLLMWLTTFSCRLEAASQDSGFNTLINLPDQHLALWVSVAADRDSRERGLMHRRELGRREGMLFVYPSARRISIWMKNTLLPLDVLFLDDSGRVVAILDNLPPCRRDPCRVYQIARATKYMLEVNAGFAADNGISIGQALALPEVPYAEE